MRTTRILAATAAAAALGLAGAATASAGVDPRLNQPSYWENGGQYDCSKVEFPGDTKTYTVPAGTGFVVIKAGTVSTQYWMGESSYQVTLTKGISHVITCNGDDYQYPYPPS